MGILRADRITGLGGANAIKGSVMFTSGGALDIDLDGTSIGTSNFTIEAWVFWFGNATHQITGSSSNNFNFYIRSTDGDLGFYNGSSTFNFDASTIRPNEWTHVALVREGTSSAATKVYVNGVNTNTVTLNTDFSFARLLSGINYLGGSRGYGNGHTSNLRFTLDTVYTSAFTPPNHELTILDNTIVLCCQSPGNVLQEATGKTVVVFKHGVNQGDPVASHFTPNSPVGFSTTTDVGSQYGTTFDGFTVFATSTYMVPPGGNTRERNRGRGIIAGGARSPYLDIEVIDIASEGNGQDFGDLNTAASLPGSASSSTRMLITGMGQPANTNIIEFITIANIASSEDFGDMTVARRRTQSLSNSTRGVHVAGSGVSPLPYHNTIDYNAIATAGNSIDFGDTSASTVTHGGSVASSTRGIYDVALVSPSYVNSIEYITIASTGNGQDFGDLSQAKGYRFRGSICDTTRGLFAGGYNPVQDTIEFVTMATLGNSTDFGNLTVARRGGGGTSNSIKSIFAGGYLPGVANVIDSVIIQTTGNAKDFGDLLLKSHDSSGSSDSHGGLS